MSAIFSLVGWDAEAEATLHNMSGRATHGEIAEAIGCSTKTIQRRKRALGIPTKRAKFRCPTRASA